MTKKIKRLSDLLEKEYGKKVWKVHGDTLSILIGTILSQNTSDNNSHKAFANLRSKFKSWEEVRKAKVKKIADTIRSGGLGEIKALRIKNILSQIYEENRNLNLSFLKRWRADKIKSWLRKFKGVGDKTIACVLLFSFKRGSMPVDTHVWRVSKRLGLVPQNSNVTKAEALLEKLIPKNLMYQFHLNLIAHGRMVCKAANPNCQDCVLFENCEFGKKFRRSGCPPPKAEGLPDKTIMLGIPLTEKPDLQKSFLSKGGKDAQNQYHKRGGEDKKTLYALSSGQCG